MFLLSRLNFVLGVANSAQMDENLGGKLLV